MIRRLTSPRNNAVLNGMKNAENTSAEGASSYTTGNYLHTYVPGRESSNNRTQ